MEETRLQLREAKTDEEEQDAALTLEALSDERRRHEQIIQKGINTRLENKRAARYKRMGGQTEPPPLRWSSLFDSDVKEADEGVIAAKSGAGSDAAGAPRKKLWRCISAPERTREELRALMNGELGTAAGRGDLVRLALRLSTRWI